TNKGLYIEAEKKIQEAQAHHAPAPAGHIAPQVQVPKEILDLDKSLKKQAELRNELNESFKNIKGLTAQDKQKAAKMLRDELHLLFAYSMAGDEKKAKRLSSELTL